MTEAKPVALPVALVLGGTTPHVALIDSLRARGYSPVLVDYLENPPARAHADAHVRESTLDPETVLRVATERAAALVIATCVDQANVTACHVSEKLGLPHPYSYETAATIGNKGLMKARIVAAGLPTARHIHVCVADLNADGLPDLRGLRFPLVVKPADSNGSAGVRRADTPAELADYLARALKLSRAKQAVVEEFVAGAELSIDCFVEQGRAKVVLVRRKYKMRGIPGGMVIQSTGSIAPWPLTIEQQAHVEDVLSDLAAAFGLDNVPMLVQAFLTDRGLSLIEFAARLSGGTGAATTKLISGFDAIEAALDSWLGIPVTVRLAPPGIHSMTNTVYAATGVFDRIEGVDALLADGTIARFLPYKTQGMEIGDDMSTRSRIGAFLVTGPDLETVLARARRAIDRLEVRDAQGRAIMCKDIFGQLANEPA